MRFFKAALLRLPAPLIAAALWALSSQSSLPRPPGPLAWDKLQHLIAYGALGFAAGLWMAPAFWRRRPRLALLAAALAGSAYGAIDEIHQHFVPGRHSSFFDWLANALGSLLGALAVMLIMRKLAPPKAPAAAADPAAAPAVADPEPEGGAIEQRRRKRP